MIEFLNVTKQDKKIHKFILSDIKKIIDKNNFILGSYVFKFEKNFAKFCNSKYAISCANGTDALTLALKSLNLPKNSEVIIPAMTYCSTAFSVINANLKPVLADIDPLKPSISLKEIRKKITKKTKVIMPVHLYGSVVNINEIKNIIKNKEILIVDDCAQAHGSSLNNKKVGSLADISCFSFYPGKNLGAYGDAGIITTDKKTYSDKIKKLRNLGSDQKFIHNQIGVNSRMDAIQAAVLTRKLPFLNYHNKKRIKIANFYKIKIKNSKLSKLQYSKNCVFHQYVILCKKRKRLIKLLKKKKIQYGLHYPYALHKLGALKEIFKNQKFFYAERLAKEGISLPIDPNLSKSNLNKIIKTLNTF